MNVQFRADPAQASSDGANTAIADCDIHPARKSRETSIPIWPAAGTSISKPTASIPTRA